MIAPIGAAAEFFGNKKMDMELVLFTAVVSVDKIE